MIPEAPERLAAGRPARLFVLAREKALGRLVAARAVVDDVFTRPRAVVDGQQIVERRVVSDDPAAQIVFDDFVHHGAVGNRVMAADRDAPHVDVEVFQRTRLIVVDLLVAEIQLDVRRERLQRGVLDLGRRRVVLDLLDGTHPERAAGIARQIEALEHEETRLALAAAAVVAGIREKQLVARARHADVEKAPLLLQMEVAGRHGVLHQRDRQLERVAAAAQRELLLDQVHQEHDGELEPLGLVDRQDADGRRLDVGLGDCRVFPGVD